MEGKIVKFIRHFVQAGEKSFLAAASHMTVIGHFRVALRICVKASLHTKPFK